MDLQFILDGFKSQGFLGILLFGALWVIYRLSIRYDALQEKRIEEGLSNFKLISELTQAIRKLASGRESSREE